MSDAAREWRQIGLSRQKQMMIQRIPTLSRKTNMLDFDTRDSDYHENFQPKMARHIIPSVSLNNDSRVNLPDKSLSNLPVYPRFLLRAFLLGLCSTAVGIALLLLTVVINRDDINMAGSGLLALGSVTVVITLLRGQDLDEHHT